MASLSGGTLAHPKVPKKKGLLSAMIYRVTFTHDYKYILQEDYRCNTMIPMPNLKVTNVTSVHHSKSGTVSKSFHIWVGKEDCPPHAYSNNEGIWTDTFMNANLVWQPKKKVENHGSMESPGKGAAETNVLFVTFKILAILIVMPYYTPHCITLMNLMIRQVS